MTHNELVAAIAAGTGTDAAVFSSVLGALAYQVQQTLSRGGRVQLGGVMVAQATTRKARTGRNPRTGEAIEIPEHRGVRLTPAAALKRAVTEEG